MQGSKKPNYHYTKCSLFYGRNYDPARSFFLETNILQQAGDTWRDHNLVKTWLTLSELGLASFEGTSKRVQLHKHTREKLAAI